MSPEERETVERLYATAKDARYTTYSMPLREALTALRALLDAPEETVRGTVEYVRVQEYTRDNWPDGWWAECSVRCDEKADAERVAEMLRSVARRVRP